MSDTNTGSSPDSAKKTHLGSADLPSIQTHITAILALLPELIGMTARERQFIAKAGPRSAAFLHNGITVGLQNPGMLPAKITPEELAAQYETLKNLREVQTSLRTLLEQVDDTEMKNASELYAVARVIYSLMKSPVTEPGLTEHRSELSKRFARKPRKDDAATVKGGVAA